MKTCGAGRAYEEMTLASEDNGDSAENDDSEGSVSQENTSVDEYAPAVLAEELKQLRKRHADVRAEETEAKQEFEKVSTIWNHRQNQLESELSAKKFNVNMLERKIEELQLKMKIGPPPPGPDCLRFVTGETFTAVASVVIITNLVTMTQEVLHPDVAGDLFWLDQFFLLFYIVELSLKAVYLQRTLLCGPFSVVWWNWLDLVIVVVGMLEDSLTPLAASNSSNSTKAPRCMAYLRVLRLARLARLLKLVKIFLQSDLAWTEGTYFQSFIMAVIGFNAILMGMETETPQLNFVWFYVEQLLLLIFTFELVVRLKRSGCRVFFTSPADWTWNLLDFIIVAGGIVDQWMLPTYRFIMSIAGVTTSSKRGRLGQLMAMLRMARLLRILRLVRLIKNIPPLYNLVVGIAKAMQGMAWVMILTAMVLYICALVGVKVLGPKGLLWGGNVVNVPEDVTSAFPDIFGAIFNLFKVMNADMSPMEGLFDYLPVSKLLIGFYVVVTNWAIFSILTAVVSDNMARVTESTEEEASAEKARTQHEILVEGIFQRLDREGAGEVTAEALKHWLGQEQDMQQLCEEANVCPDDLRDFFQILHKTEEEDEAKLKITKQDLIKGLEKEGSTVNQRSMMRLDKRVQQIERRLFRGMDRLERTLQKGAEGAARGKGQGAAAGLYSCTT